MKTLYKICAIIATVFVFGLCIVPFNRTAKAADINEPTYSDRYSITTINIAEWIQWREIGNEPSPAMILNPLQLTIYGTKDGNTEYDIPSDTVRLWNTSTGNYGTENLPKVGFNSMFEAYMLNSPTENTTVTNYQRYISMVLWCKAEMSDIVSGEILSYTVAPYKNTTLPYNNGFSVQVNFTNGYKKYNFYMTGYQLSLPSTSTTTAIQINSTDTINSYYDGYSKGKEEGYNNGYKVGEQTGSKTGYDKGYTKGYNDGRTAPEYSFKEFFMGFGNAFVTIYSNMLDYEFLGINLAGLIGTIVVIATVAIVVGFLMKR